jgi:hypothetical protein
MIESTVLFSSISLLLIWVSIVWLWRDYFVDDFRQSMFKLREELFLMAVDGEISFDHPAYGMQRSAMNGMIRFGHRYSLFHFIVWTICVRDAGSPLVNEHISRWEKSIGSLGDQTRKKMLVLRMKMHMLMVAHAIKCSPVLVALVVPSVIALLLVRFSFGLVSKVFKRSLETIDAEAIAESEAHQAFAS